MDETDELVISIVEVASVLVEADEVVASVELETIDVLGVVETDDSASEEQSTKKAPGLEQDLTSKSSLFWPVS